MKFVWGFMSSILFRVETSSSIHVVWGNFEILRVFVRFFKVKPLRDVVVTVELNFSEDSCCCLCCYGLQEFVLLKTSSVASSGIEFSGSVNETSSVMKTQLSQTSSREVTWGASPMTWRTPCIDSDELHPQLCHFSIASWGVSKIRRNKHQEYSRMTHPRFHVVTEMKVLS
jgi:hypothetical protein